MCDRVGVLYAGELIEEGPAVKVFTTPATRTRSGCCGASPAAASARTTGGWTRSPASCPTRAPLPAASSPRAARSRRTLPSGATACLRRSDRAGPPAATGRRRRPELPRNTPADVRPARTGTGGTTARRSSLAARLQDLYLQRRVGAGAARVSTSRAARRDPRPGRRVRQRQDHAGPGAARPHPAGHWLGRRARRIAARPAEVRDRGRGAAAGHADRLPEPGLRAEPAAHACAGSSTGR